MGSTILHHPTTPPISNDEAHPADVAARLGRLMADANSPADAHSNTAARLERLSERWTRRARRRSRRKIRRRTRPERNWDRIEVLHA